MRRYRPALVIAFIFLYCVPVFAQGKAGGGILEAEGNAAIIQNDIAAARDSAVRDALQRAILGAVSDLLSIPVNDDKFLPVKSEIVKRQDRYISNYKITAESNRKESYWVTVNVAVESQDLKSDLAQMGFLKIAELDKTNIIVSLNVKGLEKYSDFSNLREFLKQRIKIVKNIYPRSFQWQQAHLELEIVGTAQALAEEFAQTGRYLLETDQINQNKIALSLLPRKGE